MRAYIASPFFNESQIVRVERLKLILNQLKIDYFSPKDESNLKFKGDSVSGLEVFRMNIAEIRSCDIVVCITNDKDTGTLFEAGLAYGMNKSIFYLFDGGESFNLMLSNSGVATTSFDELLGVLSTYIDGGISYAEIRQSQADKYRTF